MIASIALLLLFCAHTRSAGLSNSKVNLNLTFSKLADQYDDLIFALNHKLSSSNSSSIRSVRSAYNSQNLTPVDFHRRFEQTNTPVVIEAPKTTAPYWSASGSVWDAEWWHQHCGNVKARVRIGTTHQPLWNWKFHDIKLSHYIDFVHGIVPTLHLDNSTMVVARNPNHTYLFDFPMALCPKEVLDDFVLPRWFVNDFLSLCVDPSGKSCPYAEIDWPSLFIGPAGFQNSPLHRDTLGSAFFSIQLVGTKTWRIFNPKDAPFLYPSLADDVHFDITNVHDLNQQRKYPLLQHAQFVDVQVGPGELLFVPGGAPHQATAHSGDITIMLGMNVVNLANVKGVIATTKPKTIRRSTSFKIAVAAGEDEVVKKEGGGDVVDSNGRDHDVPTQYTKAKYEIVHSFFSRYQNQFDQLVNWQAENMPWREFERRKIVIYPSENTHD